MAEKEEFLEKLSKVVIEGDEESSKKIAEEALEAGIDPNVAIEEGLKKGMSIVGEKFENSEIFLPEVMLAADAMKAALNVFKPHLKPGEAGAVSGKIVIGTVEGDIHSIGKNLLATMLEIANFEVNDLGVEVPAMKFVKKAKDIDADIIALSALMSTTRQVQREAVEFLGEMGIRDDFVVMVGGGSVDENWFEKTEADAWAENAEEAVEKAKKLIKGGV